MSPKPHAPKAEHAPHDQRHAPKPHPKKHVPGRKHEDGPGKEGKHLRRCYEHLARVDVLLGSGRADRNLTHAAQRVRELVQDRLRDQQGEESAKVAAELARAAEHIAFAAAVERAPDRIAWEGPLEAAFRREYAELAEDAVDEHPEHADPKVPSNERDRALAEIAELVTMLMAEAEEAREKTNFARALESMRAAEALSEAGRHVERLRQEAKAA